MVVAAVDTITGGYEVFDETTPIDELPLAVISSASIPAVFVHREYKGYVLMDGGTVWNSNLISAVNKCMELVDSKSKIVIDVATCHYVDMPITNETSTTLHNIMRYREITKYYKSVDDIIDF